jgi:hypothetical protein
MLSPDSIETIINPDPLAPKASKRLVAVVFSYRCYRHLKWSKCDLRVTFAD